MNLQFLSIEIFKVLVDGAVNNPGIQILVGSFSRIDSSQNSSTPSLGFVESESKVIYYFPKLFDAIRVAGGINQYSNIKEIKLIRKNSISNGGGKKITTLNIDDITKIIHLPKILEFMMGILLK